MHNIKKYQLGGGTASPAPKQSGFAAAPWGMIGSIANMASSFLPQLSELSGSAGNVAAGLNTAYDMASDAVAAVPGFGSIASGIMKIGGFLTKGLNALGIGTDGMCVCAGTKVYTADGTVKNIENLVEEDGIIGWDEKVKSSQIKLRIPTKKECVKITFSNNSFLECSLDHPIYTKVNGQFHFIKADDLTKGSVVAAVEDITKDKITELVVTSIKNIGEKIVYNLEAIDHHTYLANNIITHNTTQDAILGSPFFALTPWGLLNGIFGHKAESFTKDEETFGAMGDSYSGSESMADTAAFKSNKKYGLFSQGARHEANRQINEGKRLQGILQDIRSDEDIRKKLQFGMNGANYLGQLNMMNGGYRQGMIHSAKHGDILFSFEQRLRVLHILRAAKGKKINIFTMLNWPESILKDTDFINFSNTLPFDFLQNFDEKYNSDFKDDLEEFYNLWKEQGSPKSFTAAQEKEIPLFTADGYLNPELAPEELKESNEENPDLTLVAEEKQPDEVDLELEEVIDEAEKFQKGGQLNVIPEGALHARKHNLEEINEDLKGNITHKGIPVVSVKEGDTIELQAEIERNEIILNLEITQLIEELRKQYHEEESASKKDEIARKAGELLSNSIIEDTDDRTGLMKEVKE